MSELDFALFETAIGRCGIVWSERGISGVQFPEGSEQATRNRLQRRFPNAHETAAPPAVQHTIAEITALLADPPPVISFTFGCPSPEVISALQDAGSLVAVTVTSPGEAALAAAAGADALCVQGYEAGAHRGTFTNDDEPGRDYGLLSLIGAVVAEIAAGSAGAGSGLAYRIAEAGYRLNIPRMFAALLLLSLSGIVIFYLLTLVNYLALRRWHESALAAES